MSKLWHFVSYRMLRNTECVRLEPADTRFREQARGFRLRWIHLTPWNANGRNVNSNFSGIEGARFAVERDSKRTGFLSLLVSSTMARQITHVVRATPKFFALFEKFQSQFLRR